MKRFLSMLLILMMVLSLAACGAKKEEEEVSNTPAGKLKAAFKEIATDDSTTDEIAEKLMNNEVIEFGPASMPVEPGYLNGFTDEITGFSEGTMFGPMIGAIPFVGYVFRSDDPEALVKTLEEKADLRWNVCTQADEMQSAVKGQMVFFVMSPASFDEEQ